MKKAASCVSHISQLIYYFANPLGPIEDQWVRNNISKFQLNPTVDEVTMAILVKELEVEKFTILQRSSGAFTALERWWGREHLLQRSSGHFTALERWEPPYNTINTIFGITFLSGVRLTSRFDLCSEENEGNNPRSFSGGFRFYFHLCLWIIKPCLASFLIV